MANILPEGKSQFVDGNGKPYAGGFVYFYIPSTTTPKNTYQDAAQTILNTNPIVLDGDGRAIIFGSGAYRQQLYDVNSNLVWDQLVYSPVSSSDLSGTGVPGGAGLIGFDGTTLDQQFKSRVDRVVDSISQLRALAKTTYTRVHVTGYYSAGDGGGGFYWYDPSDTTSTDNGGTIIVAADGGRWKLEGADTVSIKQFGAKGDSSTDDTTAIQAAITAVGHVTIPKSTGNYLVTSTVNLPNRKTIISGDGQLTSATLIANGIFQQTNRGILTKIDGVNFSGASVGFYRNGTDVTPGNPYNGEFFEFSVSNCSFVMNAGIFGIQLFGSREGLINDCYFETGSGISLDTCINVEINNCVWKSCSSYAINEKNNTQGTKVLGGTALGCATWLLSNGCEGTILTGVMADFNDTCIVLQGAIDASIINCYLSCRLKPAVVSVVGSASGTPIRRPLNVRLIGNTIVNNYVALNPGYTGHDTNGVDAEQCNYLMLQGNFIKNWTQAGVTIVGDVNTLILNNTIYQHPTVLGTSSIFEPLSDCVATTIHNNTVTTTTPFSGVSTTDIFNNYGYNSEASGSASIASGNTSVVVNHGMSNTPGAGGVSIMPVTTPSGSIWVTNINSTSFTVNISVAPGGTFSFQWRASIKSMG